MSTKKEKEARKFLTQFDVSAMIDKAKSLDRHFIIHCGPTNSGKTYDALQALRTASNGCYLGPLRLLALEVFDNLNNSGTLCSLLTGEESIPVPYSTVVASTIEMCNFGDYYDVAVIDEAQMISDTTRGGHWLKTILCVNAKDIHICVAPEAAEQIVSLIEQIGSPVDVVKHERLTPLTYAGVYPKNAYDNAQPGDAFIAFSRKSVLAIAATLEAKGIHASVIYGALPPQSRREEVRKFVDGENSVVVATDAIGMGVSLPIRRIIFCQASKYDGVTTRSLTYTEIQQIAGRAGRYGIYDEGRVLTMEDGKRIEGAIKAPALPLKRATIPFP